VKKVLLIALAGAAIAAAPVSAASPTVRLTILHVVSGCHVWADQAFKELGAQTTITVKPGTRLEIRPNCPMTFEFRQRRGPKLRLGDLLTRPGTSRTIVFAKRGVYVLTVRNLETPEQVGLQTLGETNGLKLTVRVK